MVMASRMARGRVRRPYDRTSHSITFLYEAIFAQLLANGVQGICAYVLRFSEYSGFLRNLPTNTNMWKRQILARAIRIQKENWGEPRIFQGYLSLNLERNCYTFFVF